MIKKQNFARVVWWRYWKQLQTLNLSVRTPKPFGFYYFLKLDYELKENCRNPERQRS